MWVWPHTITRASERVTRCTSVGPSRSAGRPAVWLPGEAWRQQHQRLADPQPALGGQPAQVVQLVGGQLVGGPLGRLALLRAGTSSSHGNAAV